MPVYIIMADKPAIKWSAFAHETHSHRKHIYHRVSVRFTLLNLIHVTLTVVRHSSKQHCPFDNAHKSDAYRPKMRSIKHTTSTVQGNKVNNTTYSPIFPFPKQPTISHTLIRTMIHPVAGFHTPFIASTRDEVVCLCETIDPAVL